MAENKIIKHELKCVNPPFKIKWDGNKNWEFRKNDRDYKVGDMLIEKEYDLASDTYSGRAIEEQVTYILHGGEFGVPEGYCIMSTKITRLVYGKNDESR